MFRRLRLRARLVACNKQQTSVHYSRAIQHCRHQNVVTWTVYEGDVSLQYHCLAAMLTWWRVGGCASKRLVALRCLAARTTENFAVRVAEFYSDVSDAFV